MPTRPQPVGRRERNKQDKLARIIAATSELFDRHGVGAVTTQQIADKADIGTGTLFLYAKSKSELLLLVQNSSYVTALDEGMAEAATTPGVLDAVMAIIRPIVECNRVNVENGRAYLRELVFGDPEEPHHQDALSLTIKTGQAITATLCRDGQINADDAAKMAQTIAAIMFVSMATPINANSTVDDIIEQIDGQLRVLLRH